VLALWVGETHRALASNQEGLPMETLHPTREPMRSLLDHARSYTEAAEVYRRWDPSRADPNTMASFSEDRALFFDTCRMSEILEGPEDFLVPAAVYDSMARLASALDAVKTRYGIYSEELITENDALQPVAAAARELIRASQAAWPEAEEQ
jgi:hypothetical protein